MLVLDWFFNDGANITNIIYFAKYFLSFFLK